MLPLFSLVLAFILFSANYRPSDSPVVGIVDESLVTPWEWAKDAAPWSAAACARAYEKAGFQARILKAGDLTPEGLAGLQAVVIPGDHVYPERGKWNGPVMQALADFVRRGGIYVMPVGVSHYVARDITTGVRDTGHFDGDALGLAFEVSAGAAPLSLTGQGKALGLPDPARVGDSPARALKNPGPMAVLAWDSQYVPAMSAVPIGRGWVIHTGVGEKMDAAFAEWWLAASAKAARAALDGRLKALTLTETLRREGLRAVSLDDLDRRAFAPGPSPMETPAVTVALMPMGYGDGGTRGRGDTGSGRAGDSRLTTHDSRLKSPRPPIPASSLSLDGPWEMAGRDAGRGSEREFLSGKPWPGAIPAKIPCSVHTALLAAGKIPDPSVGFNADIAREQSYREWWFRRRFARPQGMGRARLVFDGVDYSCTVWLNGARLGRHEGAFGGPDYDITGLLRGQNTLVVRLDPVPLDWQIVLKTNVVYGWHYVNLPSLGIWRPVRLVGMPPVKMEHSFIAARDARKGVVDLAVTLRGEQARWSGTLTGMIEPDNFQGRSSRFSFPVASSDYARDLHLRFPVPDPHLWWPNDLGAPNLYRLRLSFTPAGGGRPDFAATTFGIRTIETRPLPEGPLASRYKWTFVINGRPVFLKGANWCILDALLRLDRARYARFLTLARDQHLQVLRAWGGGLLENDDFYDLCDRLGVMVYQEFPLTWQKFELLSPSVVDETAIRNVRRLRNHPSLLMWGGGNEHSGKGRAVEQIGRICLEMDGTRPFHRTDPYGGSLHNYDVYWGRAPLDRNLNLTAPFIGEFGLASPPNLESVLRYLPPKERDLWPPPDGGSFVKHTPTFNKQHVEIMTPYAAQFADTKTMAGFITGMQMAQATGIRHTLERARTRWPEATGVCYYKLTDVYPACAWATVDWYGVPKIAYHFIRSAYAPLHACALLESLSVPEGKDLTAPVYLLDDADRLRGDWQVVARVFDSSLRPVMLSSFRGRGAVNRVRQVGELTVPAGPAQAVPLLIVLDVRQGNRVLDRTFYWLNYAAEPGCLFDLPRANLAVAEKNGWLIIANLGGVPAVGVHFDCPALSDRFTAEDSYFWLDPGEVRAVRVSHTQGVKVKAWNAE